VVTAAAKTTAVAAAGVLRARQGISIAITHPSAQG
jgi:hypothetical protein